MDLNELEDMDLSEDTLLERFRKCEIDENNETEIYMDGEGVAEVIAALELKESLNSLPEMGEIEKLIRAVEKGIECPVATGDWTAHRSREALAEIELKLRTAIASAHAEKQRADEALVEFGRQTMEQSARNETKLIQKDEQIATLTTERDEARRLLKISMDANLSYHDLQVVLEDRSSLRLSILSQADATRILELCGGRNDT